MSESLPLRHRIKETLVSELMLQVTPAEIADDTPLFGPDGLGLDSVDALQLAVAMEKHYGLKVTDTEIAKAIMRSVNTLAEAVEAKEA
jgi:acyl carrier protein